MNSNKNVYFILSISVYKRGTIVDRFLVVYPGQRFLTAKDLPPCEQRTGAQSNFCTHRQPQCQNKCDLQKDPFQGHLPNLLKRS